MKCNVCQSSFKDNYVVGGRLCPVCQSDINYAPAKSNLKTLIRGLGKKKFHFFEVKNNIIRVPIKSAVMFEAPLVANDGVYAVDPWLKGDVFKKIETPQKVLDILAIARSAVDTVQVQGLDDFASCTSTDETRYFMNGIYFGEEAIVTTDAKRMMWRAHTPNGTGIIQTTGIEKYITEYGIKDNEFVYKGAGFEIYGKCIDGTFPPYKKVIPDPIPTGEYELPSLKKVQDRIKEVRALNEESYRLFLRDGTAAVDATFIETAIKQGFKTYLQDDPMKVMMFDNGVNKLLIMPLPLE